MGKEIRLVNKGKMHLGSSCPKWHSVRMVASGHVYGEDVLVLFLRLTRKRLIRQVCSSSTSSTCMISLRDLLKDFVVSYQDFDSSFPTWVDAQEYICSQKPKPPSEAGVPLI